MPAHQPTDHPPPLPPANAYDEPSGVASTSTAHTNPASPLVEGCGQSTKGQPRQPYGDENASASTSRYGRLPKAPPEHEDNHNDSQDDPADMSSPPNLAPPLSATTTAPDRTAGPAATRMRETTARTPAERQDRHVTALEDEPEAANAHENDPESEGTKEGGKEAAPGEYPPRCLPAHPANRT